MDGNESDYEIAVQDSDATVPALQELTEEAEETLTYQIDTITDIDDKALRIYRANILLLSVVIGALSIAVKNSIPDLSYFVSLNTGSGILLLLISIASAGVTYTSSDLLIGIQKSAIADTLREDYNKKDLLLRLSKGYGKWIDSNDAVIEKNGELITYTILLSVDALAFLSSGVFLAAVHMQELHLLSIRLILVVILPLSLLAIKLSVFPSTSIIWYTGGIVLLTGIVLGGILYIQQLQLLLIQSLSIVSRHSRFITDTLLWMLIAIVLAMSNYWIYNMDY
ncbi:hypothetical protein M0R89_09185 [Halorussus limi]|uniref:Uncharacterized protein n=1 Tax=Halorussus limi TaxID=2938695 RepID=A0A8U0HPD2_9EURY|nr:hypothetical protein [Halorussus limi]UPV72721.1 hypothetical protein M0R89_09185 [Halorussus limi]